MHRGNQYGYDQTVFASREASEACSEAAGLPRPEYPRPQFARREWVNLNGSWRFAFGAGGALPSAWELPETIIVPFAPEAELSGIGYTGFIYAVRYQREVTIPSQWAGKHIILNFGAADFYTTVWVDDTEVGRHRGGFTSFSFDITEALTGTSFVLSVLVEEDPQAVQARGKQSRRLENYEAFYTRTTGIWQTVWMEPVNSSHFSRPVITPDLNASRVIFGLGVVRPSGSLVAHAEIFDDDGMVVSGEIRVTAQVRPTLALDIPAARLRVWAPDDPFLYRTRLVLTEDGIIVDEIDSYVGMRSISIDGRKVLLNGYPVFQRLVLDQGYWRTGLMTAPTDEDLVRDIHLALSAGFNGARLHQKVFEERYLYHADRLGYLVWGEFADWGAHVHESGHQEPTISFVTEWTEALTRDLSHPSIVGWCPLNETFEALGPRLTVLDDATKALYMVTKAIDPTRPVIDASGYSHRIPGADIYDAHLYEQDPTTFGRLMSGLAEGSPYVNMAPDGTQWSVPYSGQPYFCSEFGGIWWSNEDSPHDASWGYGKRPVNQDEWLERFRQLVETLINNPDMFGYCFTQLTDVFQEENGIVTFDRQPKFNLSLLKNIQRQSAAIESADRISNPEENQNWRSSITL